MMKPSELGEAFADILTEVCLRVFRPERLTDREWDLITERLLLLAAEEKRKNAGQ
jgi:hypothetical protein